MGSRRLTLASVLVLSCLCSVRAGAQDFRLSGCRVLADDGSLVKISCGEQVYWVVGRSAAAQCTAWSRNCPAWEQRSALLDDALLQLEQGGQLLKASQEAGSELETRFKELAAYTSEVEATASSMWTTLEVIGSVAVGGVVCGVVGVLLGVFAL